MKRKINSDYNVFLFGVIFTPIAMLFAVYWNNTHPDLNTAARLGRVYTILALMEAYLVFGLMKVIRNRKFLDMTFNTGTLKESMEKALNYLKVELKKAKIAGLGFMYSILTFILIDIFMGIEGFGNLNFSITGSNIFSSYFAVFVVLIMLAFPSIMKFELKRYTQSIQDIDQTLLELKEED
jgi:hypothetical protein